MSDLRDHSAAELQKIRRNNLERRLKTISSEIGPEIICEGSTLLNFSSNNYLGLADHPALKKAALEATALWGTGSGASRLITGSQAPHSALEKKIATFKRTEAALVFNSGYHANLGVIPTLTGKGDLIASDELNHASLIDAARLSKAATRVYPHNDVAELAQILRAHGAGKKLIVTDSVFSMDGDLAPLPEILKLAEEHDAWLFVDEAHGTGVFGKTGRGVVEHFGIPPDHPRLIQMGTLGKALGSFGAYVCGPRELIDLLINRARTFIYTTALPPGVAAASMAAIDLISNDFSLSKKLWENIGYFSEQLKKIGLISPIGPISPILIGDSQKTMAASQKLFEAGIWATGIRPPTVPEGTARLRLTLMATHTRAHLDQCLTALERVLK